MNTTQASPKGMRVGILSQDATLSVLLSSVLGSEFVVRAVLVSEAAADAELFDQFDVLILDVDSTTPPSSEEWSNHLLSPPRPPVIIMADDEHRGRALELVECGAHGHVRKPPAVRELRSVLRSECEHRSLKGELEAARRKLEKLTGLDQLTGSSAQMQLV